MRQIAVLLLVTLIGTGGDFVQAQTLKNTSWKFYVQQLNDSFTMRLGTDTTFVTAGTGELVIRTSYQLIKDTLKIKDIDGQYACPDGEGVYRYVVDGDKLNLFMIADPCTERAGVYNGITMKRKPEVNK